MVLGTRGLGGGRDYAVLNQLVTQQSYQLATNEVFYLCGFVCLLLAGLIWLARPKAGAGPALGH